MNANYVNVVPEDDSLDGPSCHVCGAIMVRMEKMENSDHSVLLPDMVKAAWKCLSCGTTTEATDSLGEQERR